MQMGIQTQAQFVHAILLLFAEPPRPPPQDEPQQCAVGPPRCSDWWCLGIKPPVSSCRVPNAQDGWVVGGRGVDNTTSHAGAPPPHVCGMCKLRPCLSYSRHRDRINLGLFRSYYSAGGVLLETCNHGVDEDGDAEYLPCWRW